MAAPALTDDTDDGGWGSRKMIMAYAAMALALAGFVAAGHWPALSAAYPSYIMGLLGAASIYTGGNAATRWMHLKHSRLAAKTEPEGPGASAPAASDVAPAPLPSP